MRLNSLLRKSTPFRLALTFAALLVGAFLLSGAVVYQSMNNELNGRLDDDLRKTFALLSTGYDRNDLEDLTTAVQSHADLSRDGEQLFGLWGPDGQRLAGTLPSMSSIEPGLTTVPADALGQKADSVYRVLSGPVGSLTLAVAYSTDETEELRMVVLSGLVWATVITAGLAIAGGALLATRVQRRLDAIGTTMNSVSKGRLDARIPLIGNHDDIDAVSSQVNAALDRITALMEGLRQVGYDIAHDLRTPLNRARIALEHATGKAASPEHAADLEDAMLELDRATQTFDALLRIAQLEAGARRAGFRPVDLSAVLRETHEIYAEVAVDAGKALTIEKGNVPPVQGDRELLVQLLANLVENAINHTPAGTRIVLRGTSDSRRISLTVADDGPGIPVGERERVFQRLYRMDKSRTTPGSGLGLSMAKAIADLHGATIGLSDANPGLLVSVDFPAS